MRSKNFFAAASDIGRTVATKSILLVALMILPLTGCALLQPPPASTAYRHQAFRVPDYEASVDVRAPLDGSEKPEIVARITFGPNK
ncbi:MAG: hypothetical protein QM775_13880 [Pirellulales bacterium]